MSGQSRKYGAVAAGHPLTAHAAAEVLRAGGNAFDATIAGLLTACIAEPVLCSLGGGGFTLAHPNGARARVYDFFVNVPSGRLAAKDSDFTPVIADFGTTTQEFHIGRASIAVPGMVAGLFALHRDLGRMPLTDLAEPAIGHALNGVQVDDFGGYLFSVVGAIYAASRMSLALYGSPDDPDRVAGPGDNLRNPGFADFIDALSRADENLFYQGEVAQRILDDMRAGGLITEPDLTGYTVAVRDPIRFRYRDATVYTNPPPASGGLLIRFAMELLQSRDLGKGDFGHIRHLRDLIAAMALTNSARDQACANDKTAIPDPSTLFAESFLDAYRAKIGDRPAALRGTTHMSIQDADGNIATTTITNGEGSAYVVPGTGIMLNNMLGEEDLNPHGFHCWPAGTRMTSMMSPTIVETNDQRLIATGSGGSNRIRTAVLQVLLNLLDFRMSAEEAVNAPRVHFESGTLSLEPGLNRAATNTLADDYPNIQTWTERNMFFGGAHTVCRTRDGFTGAGDPRRAGVFLVV